MSRARAVKRAARLVEAERARAARARRAARRAALQRLKPRLPDSGPFAAATRSLAGRKGRRTGRLYPRRTRAQRAGIMVVGAVALAFIWLYAEPLPTRVALTALVVAAAPVLIVLTLDRRT